MAWHGNGSAAQPRYYTRVTPRDVGASPVNKSRHTVEEFNFRGPSLLLSLILLWDDKQFVIAQNHLPEQIAHPSTGISSPNSPFVWVAAGLD